MTESIMKHIFRKNTGINTKNQFHLIALSTRVDKNDRNIIKLNETRVVDKIGVIIQNFLLKLIQKILIIYFF